MPVYPLPVRPADLVRLIASDSGVADLAQLVHDDPLRPIMLVAQTSGLYRAIRPAEEVDPAVRRVDLAILQRLGMAPGDVRPARALLAWVLERIEDVTDLGVCPDDYARGRKLGLAALVPTRSAEELAQVKEESAAALLAADHLHFRPHHLLCMGCFYGRTVDRGLAPIAEDNLYEGIVAMQRNPEIPVTLIEGCCDICPPCPGYDPASGVCVAAHSMGLRDELKDLTLLQRLGLRYGDTLPARELLRRVFAAVAETTEVCGFGDGVERSPEWRVCCGPDGSEGYRRARGEGLGVEGVTGPASGSEPR